MIRLGLFAGIVIALLMAFAHHVQQRPLPTFESTTAAQIRGAYHLHTAYSHDSKVPLEAYVAAAKKLGLDFLVVTDHNNQLAGPVISDGILVLSSAELSTPYGHVIQLGANDVPSNEQRNTPEILDQIVSLKGAPILAHPNDIKRPWTGPTEYSAGLEIANLSASTRKRAGPLFLGLFAALAAWNIAPNLALAQLYQPDEQAIKHWDAIPSPQFIGLCGIDAHGYIDLEKNLSAWNVVIDTPLPAEMPARATALLEAIQQGHFACVASVLAGQPMFHFGARLRGDWVAGQGDTIATDALDQLVIHGPHSSSPSSELVLLRNGKIISATTETTLLLPDPTPGLYRAELRVQLPNVMSGTHPATLVYSNRLQIVAPAPPTLPSP